MNLCQLFLMHLHPPPMLSKFQSGLENLAQHHWLREDFLGFQGTVARAPPVFYASVTIMLWGSLPQHSAGASLTLLGGVSISTQWGIGMEAPERVRDLALSHLVPERCFQSCTGRQ